MSLNEIIILYSTFWLLRNRTISNPKKPQQNSFIIISIKIQNQHFLALKPFFLRKFIAKKVLWLNITKWPFICHKYSRFCFTAVFCEETCTCSITLIKLWKILPHIENRINLKCFWWTRNRKTYQTHFYLPIW